MSKPVFCLDGYISAARTHPPDGATVLVASETWTIPRVCVFDAHFRGRDMPAFLDGFHGRWFWYPERMCWQAIDDDEGEPMPKPAANDAEYFAEAA